MVLVNTWAESYAKAVEQCLLVVYMVIEIHVDDNDIKLLTTNNDDNNYNYNNNYNDSTY